MIKLQYSLVLFCLLSSENVISQTRFVSYKNKHIVYEGRIPYTKDAAELTWPGTSVKINFKGTAISGTFKDQDTANYYNVIVDNDSMYEIHFDTSKQTLVLGYRPAIYENILSNYLNGQNGIKEKLSFMGLN